MSKAKRSTFKLRIVTKTEVPEEERISKASHGGARFHPPGRKYGRPPKAVKVKHLRSAIAEPESPEEVQAIEWWKGLSPKERLMVIVAAIAKGEVKLTKP